MAGNRASSRGFVDADGALPVDKAKESCYVPSP